MPRILVSALVASATAACVASALAPLRAHAGPVDGDWQLAYGEDAAFTDETGQRVIGRAYQPAVTYYQPQAADPSAPPYYQPPPQPRVRQQAPPPQSRLRQPAPAYYQQPLAPQARTPAPQARVQHPAPAYYQQPPAPQARMQQPAPAYYQRQPAPQPRPQQAVPGTIIVDSPHFFLDLVLQGGHAIRYGIGVGRPGFTWAGVKEISAMREWPDWRPPVEMIKRRPDLPHFMPGGPDNPLGARALYLGSSLYRIHGSNEPWTIGTQVSSGCIRMRNDDVVDLYSRVKVGTKVIVI
jgi:lipoprotein-anchoring transpeptidase ErfK/SrfK